MLAGVGVLAEFDAQVAGRDAVSGSGAFPLVGVDGPGQGAIATIRLPVETWWRYWRGRRADGLSGRALLGSRGQPREMGLEVVKG
jgi:hypothetical protein